MADPPTLGGGTIALLLLVPVLFILLCLLLLLCKIETKKVMVPVETEPLNSMITYNEESEKKDCMEETDAAFYRSSIRRLSASVVVDQNKARVGHLNSVQNYSFRTQEGAGAVAGAGAFDRAKRHRHSSYHAGRRQINVQRFNSLRIQQAYNGYHASYDSLPRKYPRALDTALIKQANGGYHASYNSLQRKYSRTLDTALIKQANGGHRASYNSLPRKYSRTMEAALIENQFMGLPCGNQKLHAQMNVQDIYKPRVYAEEGEVSHASSLEAISISGSSVNLSSLQSFGSKFNILENVCEEHMMKVPTTEQNIVCQETNLDI